MAPEIVINFMDAESGKNRTAEGVRVLRRLEGKRIVYDGHFEGRPAVIKIFLSRVHGHRHWRREKRGLEELARRGIVTAAVLAGGRTNKGCYVLAIDKIANACDLFTLAEQKTAGLNKACEKLFVYLAQMHQAGVCQRDLHLGNFLWDGRSIYALDPAMMSFSSTALGRKASLAQAASLLTNFVGSGHAEALTQAYFRARGWTWSDRDHRAVKIMSQRHLLKSVEHGLKKTLRTSKRFIRVVDGPMRGVFSRQAFEATDIAAFMHAIDERMEAGTILKRGHTCLVSRVRLNDADIVIKRYNHKGRVHSLRHTIKGSRARKCWLFGHRLNNLQIACAKPLAFIEQRRSGLVWQSYILNAFVEGSDITRAMHAETSDAARHQIAENTCRMLNELVRCGLTHGDLKAGNILIDGGCPVLIDLDSMRRHRCRSVAARYRQKMKTTLLRRQIVSKDQAEIISATIL